MNTRAKVHQVAMLDLLQELILASFDSSYLADHTRDDEILADMEAAAKINRGPGE